jgi:hypothetical protein
LGIDGFGLVLVCLLLALQFHTGTLVEVASATGSATALARLAKWLSLSCAAMLVTAGISFVAHTIQGMCRLAGKEPIHNWAINLLAGDH